MILTLNPLRSVKATMVDPMVVWIPENYLMYTALLLTRTCKDCLKASVQELEREFIGQEHWLLLERS